MDVAAFVERFRNLPVADFTAANPHPFLFGSLDGLVVQELGYETVDPRAQAPAPRRPGTDRFARRAGGKHIFPVLARPDTPFSHMVAVGRAANNDIVLAYEGVSKLHAVFQKRSKEWVLSDSDSATGTTVDGRRLKAGEKLAVVDGAALEFGPVRLTFCLPATLHTVLQDLSPAR